MHKKLAALSLSLMISQTSFAMVKNTMFGDVYNKNDSKTRELILINNEHNKWELINPVEDSSKPIVYTQAICSGKNCISLGYHRINGWTTAPFLLTTQDGGINWKQIKYINGIHTKVSYLQGTFEHAVCYNNRCFASGFIKDVAGNDKSYSYIISEDGGSTWSIPNTQNDMRSLAVLPRLDLYCIQNQCVSRIEEKANNNVLVSQDGGNNWKLVKINLPGSKQTVIVDLKVSDHNFIVIGNYKNQKDEFHALIMVSEDGGSTWQGKLDEIKIDNHRISHVDNLTCYKNTCLAASDYRKQLVLLLSRDEANSWQLLSTTDKTPDQALSMTLKKSICTTKACSILGRFHLSNGTSPLLATVNLNESDNTYHLLSNKLDSDIELQDIHCSNASCNIAGNFAHYTHSGSNKDDAVIMLESNDMMMLWNDISDKNYIFKRGDLARIDTMALSN